MTVKPREVSEADDDPVETMLKKTGCIDLHYKVQADDDPVETMLKKTGCIDLHYKVQECIATTKDWRKCQTEVNEFRSCISKHQQQEIAKTKN